VSYFGLLQKAFNLPDDKVPDLVAGGVLAFERQEPTPKEIKEAVLKNPSNIPVFKIDKDGTVTRLSKDARDNIIESKPLTPGEIRKISEMPEKVVLGGHKLVGKSYLNYRELGSDKNLAKAQKLMDLAEKARQTKEAVDMINFFQYQKNLIEPEAPRLMKEIGSFVTGPTLGIHYSKRNLLSKMIHAGNNVFSMLAYREGIEDFGIVLASPQREGQEFRYAPIAFISRDGPEGGKIITPDDKPLSGFMTEIVKAKLFPTRDEATYFR
jgi:hypothetical protein